MGQITRRNMEITGKQRRKALWEDAIRWRNRTYADLFSPEGGAAAGEHHDFILDTIGRIAAYMVRGEDPMSARETIRKVLNWQRHRPITAQQARRVAEWLVACEHVA